MLGANVSWSSRDCSGHSDSTPPLHTLRLFVFFLLLSAQDSAGARTKNPQIVVRGVTVIGKEVSISRTMRASAFLGKPPMDSGGWPVIVWFHPGDFSSGTPILWDPSAFVIKQKVIVVAPSYRLDIFGFLSLENEDIPGNFGLMDQAASMDWVYEHIGLFNGSKTEVMIWGHSAGGTSVTLHLAAEYSPKRFQKAIAMSGNAFLPDSVVQPRRNVVVNYFLQQEYGCTREKIETCLRNLDYTALKKASEELPFELPESDEPWRWGPVVDGNFVEGTPFLSSDPKELFMNKNHYNVPIMAGFTDMEDLDISNLDNFPMNRKTFQEAVYKVFEEQLHLEAVKLLGNESACELNELFVINSILFHYTPSSPDLADDQTVYRKRFIELLTDRKFGAGTFALGKATSRADTFTYLYRFDYKMKSTGMSVNRDWAGVPHQYELPIFWGMPYWATINPPIIWNNVDKKTSDIVMSLLGNFSRYSAPIQNKKSPPWERFTELSPRLLIIDKTFNMSDSTNFDYKSVDFWNEFYPSIIDAVSNCCNSTALPVFRPSRPLILGSVFINFSTSMIFPRCLVNIVCSIYFLKNNWRISYNL